MGGVGDDNIVLAGIDRVNRTGGRVKGGGGGKGEEGRRKPQCQ